jgi:asparagine synthase (glutamine-hydrolysing)
MEGICGIISFAGASPEIHEKIDRMTGCLSDGEPLKIAKITGSHWALARGAWTEEHWQPITFARQENDLAIVGVADIYNLAELAARHRVSQNNVGAILTACYRSDAREGLLQIRGNFAVIIVDAKAQRFIAATDRIGIRSLYWRKEGNRYYLSSRLSSIRRVCPSLEVDGNAIYAYTRHSMIPSPHTIYKNVEKLEPGFLLNAGTKGHELVRYWDISATPKLAESEPVIASKVHQSIDGAVSLMKNGIAAENELGCFLSGGTDSSSICGLLSKRVRQPVAAYSIGFPENGYDEMFYARVAAKAFGLAHHEYYLQPDDVLQALPQIVTVYDEPFGNASAIPAYYCVNSAAHDGVRYILAGDGGDEIFGGNERYGFQQLFRNYFNVPKALRSFVLEPLLLNRLERLPIGIFSKAGSYIRRALMPDLERIQSFRYVTDSEMFSPAFLASCQDETVDGVSARHFNCLVDAAPLDRHLYLDMKLTVTDNDLRKVTRMCDLAQVRVRYPLLDHPVIELGFRIPAGLKLKGASGLRHIFKQAFRDLLPKEILAKQKHGFGLPVSQWLRGNARIKKFAHDLLFDQRHLQRGYFQPDFIRKLWDLQLNDKTPYYGAIIWQLVMLEAWHRRHLENEELQVVR